ETFFLLNRKPRLIWSGRRGTSASPCWSGEAEVPRLPDRSPSPQALSENHQIVTIGVEGAHHPRQLAPPPEVGGPPAHTKRQRAGFDDEQPALLLVAQLALDMVQQGSADAASLNILANHDPVEIIAALSHRRRRPVGKGGRLAVLFPENTAVSLGAVAG